MRTLGNRSPGARRDGHMNANLNRHRRDWAAAMRARRRRRPSRRPSGRDPPHVAAAAAAAEEEAAAAAAAEGSRGDGEEEAAAAAVLGRHHRSPATAAMAPLPIMSSDQWFRALANGSRTGAIVHGYVLTPSVDATDRSMHRAPGLGRCGVPRGSTTPSAIADHRRAHRLTSFASAPWLVSVPKVCTYPTLRQ